MFKELSDLPILLAFFIYTFGWGVTSPVFSIYVNDVTNNALLTGLVLSTTTMPGIFLNAGLSGVRVEDETTRKQSACGID